MSTRRWLVVLVVFAAASVLAYGNTWHVPLVFDDLHLFGDHAASVERLIAQPTLQRELGNLSFLLNLRTTGLDLVALHLTNTAIHLAAGLGVYALLAGLLAARLPNLPQRRRTWIALLGGLLFLLHPLATQAVTYIAQRYTSQAAMFHIWGLAAWVWAHRLWRDGGGRWRNPRMLGVYALALALGLAANLTKEFPISWPLTVAVLELWLLGPTRPRQGEAVEPAGHSRDRESGWHRLAFLAPTVVVAMAGLAINVWHIEWPTAATPPAATSLELPNWSTDADITRQRYLYTQIVEVAHLYLRLTVWPLGQSLDHDATLRATWTDPTVLAAAALHLLLLGGAWVTRRRWPWAGAGVWIFYVTLAPTSSLIPNHELVAEHRAYLALLGVALVWVQVALALSRGGEPVAIRRIALVGLPLAVLLGGLTAARNEVWRSDMSLWQDAREQAPAKARPYMAIGDIHYRNGRLAEAYACYVAYIARNPNNREAYYRLAVTAQRLGRFAEAETQYRRVLMANPNDARALKGLAQALIALQRDDEARQVMADWVARQPDNRDARSWQGALSRGGPYTIPDDRDQSRDAALR